jgi:hypothetical protein
MHYDQDIKVGDKTVTVRGKERSPSKSQVKAKVVAPPENKTAPRKSSGAVSKEV